METKVKKVFRCDIHSDECKGCERCVIACPRGVIKMGTKLNMMSIRTPITPGEGCIRMRRIASNSCPPNPEQIHLVEITPEEKA